jgi:F-type H+-transporting ATPase subunit beta
MSIEDPVKIIKISGNFVDVQITPIPKLHDILCVNYDKTTDNDNVSKNILLEVLYYLPNNIVRTIPLDPIDPIDPIDWLHCRLKVTNTNESITIRISNNLNDILGKIINPIGKPLDDNEESSNNYQDWNIYKNPPSYDAVNPTYNFLETGIKVIDLLIPLSKSDPVFIQGKSKSDNYKLMMNLIKNFAIPKNNLFEQYKEPKNKGYSVYSGLINNKTPSFLYNKCKESNILSELSMVVSSIDDPLGLQLYTYLSGVTVAERFTYRGKNVLLFLESSDEISYEFLKLYEQLELNNNLISRCVALTHAIGSGFIIPVFLINNNNNNFLPTNQNLNITINFNNENNSLIDPLTSQSKMLDLSIVGEEHYTTALAALELLQKYKLLQDIIANGIDTQLDTDKIIISRALKLQYFLCNFSSDYVSLLDTIKGVNIILSGKVDELSKHSFNNIGTIEQAIEKAKKNGEIPTTFSIPFN